MLKPLIAVAFCLVAVQPAQAQEQPSEIPSVPLEAVLPALPDHTRYTVSLAPTEAVPAQQEVLVRMIGDAIRGQHFYGAVYGYRPAGGDRTEYSVRSGLHSRDAARRGALADCETARSDADAACFLVGEILPQEWSEATPELSHVAVQAIRETLDSLPGEMVVARSREGDAFEIFSGENVRDAALAACNERNLAAELPADCEIVVAP